MAVAGQKRQADDTFPIPPARKRQAQVLDWASLPPDIAVTIGDLLLAEDVVDYMCFRTACASWRASTSSPRDPTLRDARFRPRRWVALCDGDGVRPADAGEIAFFNTRTGRRLRVRLPDLQCHSHRIVGFTDDGLVILFHKTSSALRVVHPFTRVSVDLPPLAPIFWSFVNDMYSIAWMNAAVCLSHTSGSIAVVVWFPNARGVICAEPGHRWWKVIHKRLQLGTALSIEGKLFDVTLRSRTLVQVYPPPPTPSTRSRQCVVAQTIPVGFNNDPRVVCYFHLVEVKGQALVVVRVPHIDDRRPYTFTLFAIDTSTGKLTQVESLGDCALFLGRDRCISVSAKDLPSVCGDSIYMSPTWSPAILHTLSNGTFERMSRCSFTSHLGVNKLHSVRPFTLVDQLLTYCNHAEWSRGFMFHEFHANAAALGANFLMSFNAQDKEVRIPFLSRYDEVEIFKDRRYLGR